MTYLAPVLEAFFTQRLRQQRDASQNTIASYRDTFRLLLGFTQQRLDKAPTQVLLADLDLERLHWLRSRVTSSSTSRSCLAKPLTVLTRFGIRS